MIRILSVAQMEAIDTALWYEERQPGLADTFINELSVAYERIRENALGLPALEYYSGKHNVRRYLMSRFPYLVIFAVMPDEIVVVAIAHTHRRPMYWLSRL